MNGKGYTRRQFGSATAGVTLAASAAGAWGGAATSAPLLPGIWRLRFGTPERLTPVTQRHYLPAREALERLPAVSNSPVPLSEISGRQTDRGYELELPLAAGEMLYGLGLQLHSFLQRGLKRKLRVNADPPADTGDSHAPVPFYVSSRGYGFFIDTARYANVYLGNNIKVGTKQPEISAAVKAQVAQLPPSYERFHMAEQSQVLVEVPVAQGVDLYVIAGPTMRNAVQRYNLFSGGGPLLPRWGLGFWYRCYEDLNQNEVVTLTNELRERKIPCDVVGLEPHWQSHSYSCSFVWSNKFPDPDSMIKELNANHYRLNLWEHAFTHPTSPIHEALLPNSGDYEVWRGLVPDFAGQAARDTFGSYHDAHFVSRGVSGFKLDECDNSDYTNNWSFPELSRFRSGADGEQMHCFFGLRYQDTIQAAFERHQIRTLGLVRSSHALATPYPYCVYSDLYNHKEFIRGVVNAGFSGLLWCPEVRDAKDTEDLIRRLQTVIFSPVAMVNAWYIRNPPWKQVDRESNNNGQFAAGWESVETICRRLIEVRMQLLPYLYSAYVRYHLDGTPPFRALAMDYPDDVATWTIDDQYLAGESLVIAPVVAGEKSRRVYLPKGDWYSFWNNERVSGGQTFEATPPLEQIPVFVKGGTLLPLAQPTLHTADPRSFRVTVHAFGEGDLRCVLYEDDGSVHPRFTTVTLSWNSQSSGGSVQRSGLAQTPGYTVESWQKAG